MEAARLRRRYESVNRKLAPKQGSYFSTCLALWPRGNVAVIEVEPQGSPPGQNGILVRAVGVQGGLVNVFPFHELVFK